MGSICPTCGEWIPEDKVHVCTGVRIPRMPVRQPVIATLWRVNTLTGAKSASLIGLAGTDPIARLKLLYEAVKEAARAMAELDRDRNALHIFVAPEFYFSNGKEHFYPEDVKERIRGGLVELSKQYPHILIVPGSVAWFKTSVRSPERAERKATEHGHEVKGRDFGKYRALYEKPLGHAPSKQASWNYDAQKRYRGEQVGSFGDRMTNTDPKLKVAHNTVFILYDGDVWHKYNKRFESLNVDDLSNDVPGSADYENIIFPPSASNPTLPPIRGVRIGVEVCADHEHGSLASAGRDHHIQIVCSGTVSVYRESAAVVERGFVLQADAETSGVYRPGDLPSGGDDGGGAASQPITAKLKASVGEISVFTFSVSVPRTG